VHEVTLITVKNTTKTRQQYVVNPVPEAKHQKHSQKYRAMMHII